ncbi:MAG TPA: hypothetical protein VNZ45_09555, partial [Bacteroidia bacterium]|nr:hypothetical protein [Bacteroidia bacterium]
KHFGLSNYFYDTLHLVGSAGKDSLVRRINNYQLVGGDFVDGKVRFTIVVNTAHNENLAWLAPYIADSSIVAGGNYGSAEIKNGSLIVVKAFGEEYSATINKECTIVTLQALSGHYTKPDIYLYDSLMPDSKFELFNGGTSSFAAYKHQHKYIYVIYWYGWQPGDTREIDALKNVSDLYRDALTVISIHSTRADTAVIKQMEKDKNIDWVEIKDGFAAEGDFPINGRTLFNEDGKAIALSLWPVDLKVFIEKLLHVSN